jgi:hypothetical protein
MADRPIYILDINPDGSLQLSDNGKTVAQPGDTIKWYVDKNSSVTLITSIHDTSETEVFNPKPFRRYDHKLHQWEWVGQVRKDHTGKSETEHYIIYYTKKGGTAVYADDPRIQVDSGPS